jgi:hypothetical protein
LVLALSGCDEHGDWTKITRVQDLGGFAPSIFTARGAGAAEVHGAPVSGMTGAETAALLELPERYPEGVGFEPLPPGGFDPRNPTDASRFRVVLAFNARSPASPQALCRTARELGGPPPDARGFTVDMALCRDMAPVRSARMEAEARGTADAAFVRRTLKRLMGAVF